MNRCIECNLRPQKYRLLQLCKACYERKRVKTPLERVRHREQSLRYKQTHREQIRKQQQESRWKSQEAIEHRRAIERASYVRNRVLKLERAHQLKAKYLGLFVEAVDWKAIYSRDDGVCQLCFEPVPFEQMSLDHVVPFAKKGKHEASNCQTAHMTCNRRKNAYLGLPTK